MSDDTIRNIELEGEDKDEVLVVLDQTIKAVGYGFFIAEVSGPNDTVACALTPVAPGGSMSVSFILDKRMLAGVIENLQKAQQTVDWIFNPDDFAVENGDASIN